MTYRLLVMIVAIVLILLLLSGFWLTARLFLGRYSKTGARPDQVNRLMAWTFAGFGVGLAFVGVGAPVLGTLAFARTARGLVDVSWPTAILWGVLSCGINALIVGGAMVALVLNQ